MPVFSIRQSVSWWPKLHAWYALQVVFFTANCDQWWNYYCSERLWKSFVELTWDARGTVWSHISQTQSSSDGQTLESSDNDWSKPSWKQICSDWNMLRLYLCLGPDCTVLPNFRIYNSCVQSNLFSCTFNQGGRSWGQRKTLHFQLSLKRFLFLLFYQ